MKKYLLPLVVAAGFLAANAEVTSFPIGETWPDSKGNHINCHGGCVVRHDGAYYWFGESRTGGHSDGISVYRSTDLYNWEHKGFAVTHGGTRDDKNLQDISEGRLLERPKVIYNAKTKKWVMWAHWENGSDYGQARVAILQSDNLTGPYTFVKTMRPNNHDSRDQTLFLDTDGSAYHLCSTNMNTDINLVRLSDDFLDCTKEEMYIMNGRRLEATTMCKYGETYFATFSECNGWDPAPGHTATAVGEMLGTWTEGLNFCVDPNDNRSYYSQGAYVFSVADMGYDPKCFIFYGDRWNSSNVGGSTYVWLPLSIRSGYPTVRNYSTWTLDEVMTDMYRYKRSASIVNGGEYSLLERNSDRLLSRIGTSAGFSLSDDDDRINIRFVFEATADPYVWKLKDAKTGYYLTARRGKPRFQPEGTGKGVEWTFVLKADGYYQIINCETQQALAAEGAGRNNGTGVVLAYPNDKASQCFGVYFDSKLHPEYREADMYTKAYFENVAKEIAKQNYQGAVSVGRKFEADVPYIVTHAMSEYVMTLSDRGTIATNENADEQILIFRTVGNNEYNIVSKNGFYLGKDPESNWNTLVDTDDFIDPSSDEFIFTVEEADGQYVIKNKARNAYLGTDAAEDGVYIYCDKAGAGRALSYWQFRSQEDFPQASDEDAFIDALDEADILLGSISTDMVGDEVFDISQTYYDMLKKALAHAFSVRSDFAKEKDALLAAVADYEANKYNLPDPTHSYEIYHSSGLKLGNVADGVKLTSADSEKVRFVAKDNGTFGIYHIASDKYLAKSMSDNYSLVWGTATGRAATWNIRPGEAGGKVFNNITGASASVIGVDNAEESAPVYSNKSQYNVNAQWRIVDCDAAGVDSPEFVKALVLVDGKGVRVVGASGFEVFNASGACVGRAQGDNAYVTLPAGFYIVRPAGNNSAQKIMIQ